MTIEQQLRNGASLRYRDPHGFYIVKCGERIRVEQSEAEKLVRKGVVRPNTKDQHGVYLFALNR